MRRLQKLFCLVAGASGGQHKLVDHHLFLQSVHFRAEFTAFPHLRAAEFVFNFSTTQSPSNLQLAASDTMNDVISPLLIGWLVVFTHTVCPHSVVRFVLAALALFITSWPFKCLHSPNFQPFYIIFIVAAKSFSREASFSINFSICLV